MTEVAENHQHLIARIMSHQRRGAFSTAYTRILASLRRRAKIGYIGWQGHGNLGDDAMYDAARVLLAPAEIIPFRHAQDEQLLRRVGLSGAGFFDSIVFGGGTLINPLWLGHAKSALNQGVPVWTLGTGVGSCGFDQPDHVPLADWCPILQHFSGLGVRGPQSQMTLQALGLSHAEIIGDLALALAWVAPHAPSDIGSIAINLAKATDPKEAEVLQHATKSLRSSLGALIRKGWRVIPVALDPSDVRPTADFMAELGAGDTATFVPKSADEFFSLVGPCHFMVGMRLHAAILSCCVGVPPLMLGYRSKCLDFMQAMGLEQLHLSLSSASDGQVQAIIDDLENSALSLRSQVSEQASYFRNRLQHYTDRIACAGSST